MTIPHETSDLLAALGVPHAFTGTLPAGARPALLEGLGLADRRLVTANQVHGNAVLDADTAPTATTVPTSDADVLVARRTDRAIAVYTADCVPVLLAGDDGRAVAAVDAMALPADRLVAAIGPCISEPHYEVGQDLATRFGFPGRTHLDLRAIARRQLADLGVERIDVSPTCTYTSSIHPSYRRDGAAKPGMLSVIAPRRD